MRSNTSRTAWFLRQVLDSENDVSPETIFGRHAELTTERKSQVYRYTASLRDEGLIESTIGAAIGPEGDLLRVRVTPYGQAWLAENEAP